jgi:cell division protein FtsI (penicillin-binding protein 3)
MRDPRYVTLVMLFEPKPSPETKNQILAGLNAAPTTARLIQRIAPLLGVIPAGTDLLLPAGDTETFDAP